MREDALVGSRPKWSTAGGVLLVRAASSGERGCEVEGNGRKRGRGPEGNVASSGFVFSLAAALPL